MDRLDDLFARLGEQPVGQRLNMLEPSVWARVHALAAPQAAPWSWAAASTAAALVLGVAVGGGAAARPAIDPVAWSAGTTLAPSTLLEGRR